MIINTNSIRLDGHVLFYDVVLSSLYSTSTTSNLFVAVEADDSWALQTHELFVDHEMLEMLGVNQVWTLRTPDGWEKDQVFISPVLGELNQGDFKTIINHYHYQSRAVAKPREFVGLFPFAPTLATS